MKTNIKPLCIFPIALASALAYGVVTAQPINSELITDAAELEAMGIDPAADADAYRLIPLAGSNSLVDDPIVNGNFGTGRNFTGLQAHEFQGRTSGFAYGSNGLQIHCTSANEPFADALFHLPHGAFLDFVRWWGFDNSSENMTLFIQEDCLPDFSAGSVTFTSLGSDSSSGTPGNFSDFINIDRTVDNMSCTYKARVRFDNSGAGSPCSEGNNLRLSKVRAHWNRQISPPPGSATFGDVPLSHIFFREIEALVDSGITGGCGGGNYCPNNPVTRGQMAAFLARALGLHFDEISDPANP